jgi:hypothetical protein
MNGNRWTGTEPHTESMGRGHVRYPRIRRGDRRNAKATS